MTTLGTTATPAPPILCSNPLRPTAFRYHPTPTRSPHYAMFPGALSRLRSSYPLRRALALAHPGEPLGAWVRMGRWPLHLRAGGCALLASADLGYLLRRCGRVLVRNGERSTL